MRLGRLVGVRLKINPLLLLLALVYGWLGLGAEVLLVLAAVLLHELAHLVAARGLRVAVQEVELLPFGGQAKIEDFTGLEPEKETIIALTGPACSLTIAAVFYFLTPYLSLAKAEFFITINLLLGLFNLLPVLPLDGGRVLRAQLSRWQGYKKATARMARLGQIAGVALVLWGVYETFSSLTGLNIILAGAILFWSARREGQLLAYSFMRYLVNKKGDLARNGHLPAQQYVSKPDTLVKTILQASSPTYYLLVVVISDNHQVQGMVSEAELIECLFEKGPLATISDC
ncbi:MAG TPA: site-2 protease family protein [Syntrophomonadaceae bacterium]|nr:site-2 protease family protein [Syntrophomonadaceae bacterium]HQE22895.1 site-2 protease family protein [Syntrophomonadaceae bacterium]